MGSMLLSEKIASSEMRYKNLLEEFFMKVFDIAVLPSHGIDHHRRVWKYSKEILHQLNDHGVKIDESLTDKLIIACFLHDSGMSVDTGPRHGIEGKRVCEKFLAENNLSSDVFSDVLQAIEQHDNKEYTFTNHPGDLLTILSVADDLDAFGFIGIYRYLEIYITRGTAMHNIGHQIIENSKNRFQNFLRIYGFMSVLIEKHTKRYSIISSFFNSYEQQITSYKFDNKSISGHCGVAEIIDNILKNKQSDTIVKSHAIDYPDPLIQWYFAELDHEFSESFQGDM
jgi:HD superfamily phosphodiesterase